MAGVQSPAPRAWLLSAFAGEREHGGNEGYADDPTVSYQFDSLVPNWKHLSTGDVVFIRNRADLLGLGRIETLSDDTAAKRLLRCPHCGDTKLKRRATKVPPYRCDACKETFDAPIETERSVVTKVAVYGSTFTPPPDGVSLAGVLEHRPRPNRQNAMQELDLPGLLSTFPQLERVMVRWLEDLGSALPAAGDGSAREGDGVTLEFDPSTRDERIVARALIRARRGQRQFRESMLARFAGRCVVTGCAVKDVLEAAHINPYRGEKDHHIDNGLLLRSDIHVLFDLDLLGIEPGTLTVRLNPVAAVGEYAALDGLRLRLPTAARPSGPALALRWQAFRARLAA